jgi:allantoicase
MEIDMYYLINIDSDLSLAQQIALCDTTLYLKTATGWADRRKADTGKNWCVIKITSVYTTQTFDEAHRAALDVPHMARD